MLIIELDYAQTLITWYPISIGMTWQSMRMVTRNIRVFSVIKRECVALREVSRTTTKTALHVAKCKFQMYEVRY